MEVEDLKKKSLEKSAPEKIETLKEALEGYDKDSESYAFTQLMLGNEYRSLGRYEDASECFEKSAEVFNALKDHLGEAAALNNLGFIRKGLGDHTSSLNNYERALSIYRSVGDTDHEGLILTNIAKLYFAIGEYLEAIEYFEDGLSAITESTSDSRAIETDILVNLGRSYVKTNDFTRSLEYFENSLQAATDDEKLRASIIREIAGVYLLMGDGSNAGKLVAENSSLLKQFPDTTDNGSSTIPQIDKSEKNPDTASFHPRVSNGIRTYLTSVIGYAQHIKSTLPDLTTDEIVDMMDDIEISAQKIKELISNLETHDSAFEGTLSINSEVTDVAEVVLSVLKASSVRIESKNLNVIFKSSQDGITAFTDREILLQIINNLVSNAIVFTPPGKNIYAYVSLDGEQVRCEIIDEGTGLSHVEVEELLNNAQGKNSHVGREESIGIGLTVANSLARKLGGELRCESMLGKGSTFVLELPTL